MIKNSDEDVRNKLNISYVNETLKDFDVVCLNDTWTNTDTEKDIHLSEFEPFCNSGKYNVCIYYVYLSQMLQ